MSSVTITGSCLCQKIRYEVTGVPKTTVLCHCNNCRKSTGASFMANSFYHKPQLRVLAGQEFLKIYEDSATDTGNTLARSFCSNCGSSMFVTNPMFEDAVIIPMGTMDLGPSAEGWAPQREFFCKRRKEWLPPLENTKKSHVME